VTQAKPRRKVVKTLAKGQVTIPNEFRKALGIVDAETLLTISLVGDHLEVAPLQEQRAAIRRFTDDDITRFLEEDKLDEESARRVRELLKRGSL